MTVSETSLVLPPAGRSWIPRNPWTPRNQGTQSKFGGAVSSKITLSSSVVADLLMLIDSVLRVSVVWMELRETADLLAPR